MEYHTDEVIKFCPYSAIVSCAPSYVHAASFSKVVFIETGSCTIEFYDSQMHKTNTAILKEGDCFIARANLPYAYKQVKEPYAHRDVYLSDEMLREICDSLDENVGNEIFTCVYPKIFHLSPPCLIYYSEKSSALLGQEKNPQKDLIHKTLVIDLIGQYLTFNVENVAKPKWLNKLLRDLDSEEFLLNSIEDMVITTNYSHGYVNREFKKYMGCSLKHFVNSRKLELSSIMLATTDFALQEIVIRFGFATTSSFITQFKEKFGITPWKYRKNQSTFIEKDSYTRWGEVSKK